MRGVFERDGLEAPTAFGKKRLGGTVLHSLSRAKIRAPPNAGTTVVVRQLVSKKPESKTDEYEDKGED